MVVNNKKDLIVDWIELSYHVLNRKLKPISELETYLLPQTATQQTIYGNASNN